jgi:para-aminobenzoate synthetase component I
MSQQIEKATELMNEFGKSKIPFLFVIDYEMNKPLVYNLADVNSNIIKYDVLGIRNYEAGQCSNKNITLDKFPISYDRYKSAFNFVKHEIETGYTYLTNLTFPTRIKINLDLQELFNISQAKFKLYIENKYVVFSPEEFVRIENGIISSFPMKGTIDASIANAQEIILSDQKEIAEHTTIVDLIRNDLSIVAKDVYVKKFRYIDKIVTSGKILLQISSEICGTLPENYEEQFGNIIFSILPAGSISGAPKRKTVEIISKAEISPRGFYTGVFGLYDGKSLYSAVMIRFIEKTGNEMIYRSGGGITYLSNAEMEYQELIDKVYVPIS